MDNWEELKAIYTVGMLGTVTAASKALELHRATVICLSNEQRRYHMTEVVDFGMSKMNSGTVIDGASEWLNVTVPLAIDTDRDGIEDALDEDIDGDVVDDPTEISAGTNPVDPCSL